ncbi:MAG: PIN domain-containing protein [Deltaproteobacteria bacterium]|nr:PIN domain-containing protein [Deltaproteobacteria bacterium]
MSLVYFDSSVVLAFLLNEKRAAQGRTLWAENKSRCSSILLEAEVWVGLRRHRHRLGSTVGDEWLDVRLQVFSELVKEASLVVFDSNVIAALKSEAIFAECRSPDAIHLATAMRVRSYADGSLRLATFDERMLQTARRLKIECIGDA